MKNVYLVINSKKPLVAATTKGNIKNIDKSITLIEFYHVLAEIERNR